MTHSSANDPDQELSAPRLFAQAVKELGSGDALGIGHRVLRGRVSGGLSDVSGELKPLHYHRAICKALRGLFADKRSPAPPEDQMGPEPEWRQLADAVLELGTQLEELAAALRALAEYPMSIEKDRNTALRVLSLVAEECGIPYTTPKDPAS